MEGRLMLLFILACTVMQMKMTYQETTYPSETISVTQSEQEYIDSLALEDFVPMNLFQFMELAKNRLITKGGKYRGLHSWYWGPNDTMYIYIRPKSFTEQLKKDIANQSGNDVICSSGICLPRDIAEKQLAENIAFDNKYLLPSDVPYFAVMVSFFIVMGIVGISGNILILSAVLRSKSVRNSTNVLMCSLAASDTLVLLVCLPFQVFDRFFRFYEFFEKGVCGFFFYMKYFSILVSVFTMSVMAIERYVAVCRPLKAKSYCTVRNARRAVATLWLVSLALPIPVFFVVGFKEGKTYCEFNISFLTGILFYGIAAFVVFIIPLTIMGPLYVKIFLALWASSREAGKLNGSDRTEHQQQASARKQVIKMLVLVLLVFVVCWGPAVLYELIQISINALRTRILRSYRQEITGTLTSIGISNSFWNPVIYTAMSGQFQAYLKSLCGRDRGGKKHEKDSSAGPSVSTKETVSK